MKVVVFYCRADSNVGMGHLFRCSELATRLRVYGFSAAIIGPAESLSKFLPESTYKYWSALDDEFTSEDRVGFLLEKINELGAKFLVVDDYLVDDMADARLNENGVSWLKFQSSNFPLVSADIIVNANPDANIGLYKVTGEKEHRQFLLGSSFAILRKEFCNLSEPAVVKVGRKLFICFGGGSDRGAIIFSLKALLAIDVISIEIVVVTTNENPNLSQIAEWISVHGNNRVSLHISSPSLVYLMQQSDLAIVSGGTLTYELAAVGIPMIIIAISENQVASSAWETSGCAKYLGEYDSCSANVLKETAIGLLLNYDERISMSRNCRKIVDGKGADRVVEFIVKLTR